jgi:hypothetical protein
MKSCTNSKTLCFISLVLVAYDKFLSLRLNSQGISKTCSPSYWPKLGNVLKISKSMEKFHPFFYSLQTWCIHTYLELFLQAYSYTNTFHHTVEIKDKVFLMPNDTWYEGIWMNMQWKAANNTSEEKKLQKLFLLT